MSRADSQVVIRLPEPLKNWLKAMAEENRRSQNAEIVHRLQQLKDAETKNPAHP